MDALLLEKAESQQSLCLLRKDLEKTKQQAKVKYSKNTIFNLCYKLNLDRVFEH